MTVRSTDTLRDIFRAVFELEPGADVSGFEQGRTEAWDSLAHVSLIAAIESEFGVNIDAAESLRLTSYAETVSVLREQGVLEGS
ncbi:MAG: acyl carrier protein [Gemmatimonadales bacterium]